MLGEGEAYLWSSLGGLIAGVVVYLIPPLIYAHETQDYSRLTPKDVLYIGILLLVLTAVSGTGFLLAEKVTSHSDAFKLGIAAQAGIKSILSGGREAFGGRDEA